MTANFTPTMSSIKDMKPFRFWCQKVLPTVYDDSLSYYELLNKVVFYLNEMVDNVDLLNDNVTRIYDAYVLLQDYVNNYFAENIPEMVYEKLFELVQEGILGFVTPNMFGAKFDGVTDDTDAVVQAHDYANEHVVPVVYPSGRILISATNSHPVVKTSTYFYGTEIIINRTNNDKIIFEILPDEDEHSVTLTPAQIIQLTEGATEVTFLGNYPNTYVSFDTNIKVGKRLNHNYNLLYKESCMVNKYGAIMDGGLIRTMADASSILMYYQNLIQKPLEFNGATFVLSDEDYDVMAHVRINRNGTIIKNISSYIDKQPISTSTDYKGELFTVERACNVRFYNLNCRNLGNDYGSKSNTLSQTTYVIHASLANRLSVSDSLIYGAWGPIQTEFTKNATFENLTVGRIDNHYLAKDYIVDNCTLTSSQSAIKVGYGVGQFVIKNTHWVKQYDYDTSADSTCIECRNEISALFAGELIIENCDVQYCFGTNVKFLIGNQNHNWNFGEGGSSLFEMHTPSIKINGLTFSGDVSSIYLVDFACTETDSYVYTSGNKIHIGDLNASNIVNNSTAERIYIGYRYLSDVVYNKNTILLEGHFNTHVHYFSRGTDKLIINNALFDNNKNIQFNENSDCNTCIVKNSYIDNNNSYHSCNNVFLMNNIIHVGNVSTELKLLGIAQNIWLNNIIDCTDETVTTFNMTADSVIMNGNVSNAVLPTTPYNMETMLLSYNDLTNSI